MGDESDVHGMFIQWMGYQWYIYIYIWYPPQNLCRLQFYWYLQWILYILAPILFPIKFEAPTVGKLKNWKTEFHRRSLGSILLLWNSVFQFFSFSVLGFSWKVKTRKAEKTEKLNSIGEVWGPFFSCGIQFFSSRLLLKGENPKSWNNWKNQVTPSCVNNLEYEHLTPRSIEATDYNRIGRLRQGDNKQIIDLWALSDNLRVGAALNAVRTAEYIINQGYLKI